MAKQMLKLRDLKKMLSSSIPTLGMSMALVLMSSSCVFAGNISLKTYYPAPHGAYDRVRLLTQSLPTPCKIGTLMVDQATEYLQYCSDDGAGNGQWGLVKSVWSQSGDYIFPSETAVNPDIFVGIGTTVPEFRLTLDNDGGILAMGQLDSGQIVPDLPPLPQHDFTSAVQMIWYPRKAAFRVGRLTWLAGADPDPSDYWNDNNIGKFSVALGYGNNKAKGLASVALGVEAQSLGDYSVNYAGFKGNIHDSYIVNWGPLSDVAGIASVNGGYLGQTRDNYNVMFSGFCNVTAGVGATIAGGADNNAEYIWSSGCLTDATKTVAADYFTISGGMSNHHPGIYSVVGGGFENSAGPYAVVNGGQANTAAASHSFIGGGLTNTANGLYSVIEGGANNTTNGAWSAILGGSGNLTTNDYAVVWGGANNRAGRSSVVAGGAANNASGNYSVISNGSNNTVASDYAWAGGRNMNLTNAAHRTFVWGYSTAPVSIATPDAFIIAPGTNNPKVGIRNPAPSAILDILIDGTTDSATDDFFAITSTNAATAGDVLIVKNDGNIGIGQPNPTYPLHFGSQANYAHLTTGGKWITISSREYKDHIQPLDTRQALAVVKALHPVTYNYKVNHEEHHVGFIAEDVPEFVAEVGRRSVDPMMITAVLAGALKEQSNEMRLQEKVFEQIEVQLQTLEKKIQQRP